VATIQFIGAYVLLMLITIPVMRWMFRAEIQEIVDKTLVSVAESNILVNNGEVMRSNSFNEDGTYYGRIVRMSAPEIVEPVKTASVPKMSYSTATNVLTIIDDNGKTIKFNMWKNTDKAFDMLEKMVKQADDLQDDAEEALLDIEEEIYRKNGEKNPHRGEGVKSKVKK
jgi:hypothetical protein